MRLISSNTACAALEALSGWPEIVTSTSVPRSRRLDLCSEAELVPLQDDRNGKLSMANKISGERLRFFKMDLPLRLLLRENVPAHNAGRLLLHPSHATGQHLHRNEHRVER